MNTTIEFLDAVKAKHCLTSDYALSKFLCESNQRISNYRVKRSFLDDSMAVKVAEALEIDPLYVIASVHAERAKKETEKKVWTDILEKLGGIAASVVIGFAACALPSPDAFAGASGVHSVYYVKSWIMAAIKKAATACSCGEVDQNSVIAQTVKPLLPPTI